MPPEAAAKSAVIADTMLPAAPVIRNTLSCIQRQARLAIVCRLLLQADRPAQSILVSDFNCAGIAQGFLDQRFSNFRRIAARLRSQPLSRELRCARACMPW